MLVSRLWIIILVILVNGYSTTYKDQLERAVDCNKRVYRRPRTLFGTRLLTHVICGINRKRVYDMEPFGVGNLDYAL